MFVQTVSLLLCLTCSIPCAFSIYWRWNVQSLRSEVFFVGYNWFETDSIWRFLWITCVQVWVYNVYVHFLEVDSSNKSPGSQNSFRNWSCNLTCYILMLCFLRITLSTWLGAVNMVPICNHLFFENLIYLECSIDTSG